MIKIFGTSDDCPDCRGLHPFRNGQCPTCGKNMPAVGLEIPELPDWLDRRLAAWLRGKSPRDVAMAVSLMPILLPFPVIGLLICAMALIREPSWRHAHHWAPIPIVAAINLALSVWFLVFFSGLLWTLLFHWWSLTPQLVVHPAAHSAAGTNI